MQVLQVKISEENYIISRCLKALYGCSLINTEKYSFERLQVVSGTHRRIEPLSTSQQI